MPTLAKNTTWDVTPGQNDIVLNTDGAYLDRNIKVNGDANLLSDNIKRNVSIFGVSGNLEPVTHLLRDGIYAIYDDDRTMESIEQSENLNLIEIVQRENEFIYQLQKDIDELSELLAYKAIAGNDGIAESIIDRSISVADFQNVTSIGSYAFYSCSQLITANFPAAISIGSYAFYSCSQLITANFPAAISISGQAFQYCSRLATASFPAATYIGTYAFASCSRLTTTSFPNVTSIGSSAFSYCLQLITANFPKAISIGSNAFLYCPQLTIANFPAVTSIGSSAFSYCYHLTTANFPAVTSIGNNAFARCSQLTTVSFPAVKTIGSSAFQYCTNLSAITIGTSNCTLGASNAFSSAAIWSNKGSIYVPADYVSIYKTRTNWSFFSNRIFPIEEKYSLVLPADATEGSLIDIDDDGVITTADSVGENTYRILDISDGTAKLLKMQDIGRIMYNEVLDMTSFNGINGQMYEDSLLDIEMERFYDDLPEAVNAAIVPQTITQSMYSWSSNANASSTWDAWYSGGFTANGSSGIVHNYNCNRVGEVPVRERYVYALDVDDIVSYFEAKGLEKTPQNLNEMFWNVRDPWHGSVWLRSASSNNSNNAFYVEGGYGSLRDDSDYDVEREARPAFIINISQ